MNQQQHLEFVRVLCSLKNMSLEQLFLSTARQTNPQEDCQGRVSCHDADFWKIPIHSLSCTVNEMIAKLQQFNCKASLSIDQQYLQVTPLRYWSLPVGDIYNHRFLFKDTWKIAKRAWSFRRGTTKPILEALGFTILEDNHFFYVVKPPVGWKAIAFHYDDKAVIVDEHEQVVFGQDSQLLGAKECWNGQPGIPWLEFNEQHPTYQKVQHILSDQQVKLLRKEKIAKKGALWLGLSILILVNLLCFPVTGDGWLGHAIFALFFALSCLGFLYWVNYSQAITFDH